MRAAGKPVISVGIPLTATDRAAIFTIGHDVLAMSAEKLEPSIDKFERLRSDATLVTRVDAARGRWLVVSEPWSIYNGWTARTTSGAQCAIDKADGVSSSIFMPKGESTLRADYAPKSVRLGLWLFATGLIAALFVALWPTRARLA